MLEVREGKENSLILIISCGLCLVSQNRKFESTDFGVTF